MLTALQHKTLSLIHRHVSESGRPPSYRELAKQIGDATSKSTVHRLIIALEERGFIRRLPHRARALEVVRLPPDLKNGCCPTCGRSYA